MEKEKTTVALVTGASSGIGRSFAQELAQLKFNLLLVALPGSGLVEMAGSLAAKTGVTVFPAEIDLMEPDGPKRVRDFADYHNLQVKLLINNVGIGYAGELGQTAPEKIDRMILLNVRCTTLMINLFIDDLKQFNRSWVLNMGSFAGFFPLEKKGIYSSSKAYVYHLSEVLRHEMKGTGVRVSVAMPGPVATNPAVKQRIAQNGLIAKPFVLASDQTAHYILKKMFAGSYRIIPGGMNKFLFGFCQMIPYGILQLLVKNLFKNQS